MTKIFHSREASSATKVVHRVEAEVRGDRFIQCESTPTGGTAKVVGALHNLSAAECRSLAEALIVAAVVMDAGRDQF